MKRKIILVSLGLAFAGIIWSPLTAGAARLALGTLGATLQMEDSMLFTAVPIINTGKTAVQDLALTAIKLNFGTLTHPSLPYKFDIDMLSGGNSTVFDADFASPPGALFMPGKSYTLTVQGTYKVGKTTNKFTLTANVLLAPASPGEADINTTKNILPHTVTGGKFAHRPVMMEKDVNTAAPPVPTAPFVPLISPSVESMLGDSNPLGEATPIVSGGDPAVVFDANNSLGLTSGTTNGTATNAGAAEPSGGVTAGGVVFVTANWTAAYSTDGVHFTQLDPTKIFPNDAVGYCCDQIVQYLPSQDLFVWLLQGNGYRLAVASPAQVISSKGTAWTYWLLTPQLFGQPKGAGFDYPDLSVGNSDLYITWDAGIPCPKGCTQGYQVARTSLAGLKAGGTITIGFTDPKNGPSSVTWGLHPTQDTKDEVFWAGHDGNNQLRVFSWAEASNTYFWRDVGISSWANNAPTSTTPDGQDWLAYNFTTEVFPRNGIIGATRSGSALWFAWSAGTDSNFPQAHIEMVELDRSNNFSVLQQVQIWNSGFAFAYPALATLGCNGAIGLSLETGAGNGNYENHDVGFWGDFLVYRTVGSSILPLLTSYSHCTSLAMSIAILSRASLS